METGGGGYGREKGEGKGGAGVGGESQGGELDQVDVKGVQLLS
jgi:hypothetical protein